jgi:hypothetical protein
MYRQVLELRQKVLGPQHPDTITSINNLACCLKGMERVGDATSLYREGLQLAQQALGAEHQATKALEQGLAECSS